MGKEHEILENVIKAEFDFIIYVDIKMSLAKVIVASETADVMLSDVADYNELKRNVISVFVHPEDQEYCAVQLSLAHIQKELEEKKDIFVEYRFLCGKSYRRKKLRIYYHNEDKNILVLVRRDVTDCYEEEQKQNIRLHDALMEARRINQEKNEFLERMSHEIRTPMNSIIGLSYLTSEHVNNQKQVLENLTKLNISAHFLLSFMDDILNLSKVESGNVALIQESILLDEFLEEISSDISKKAEKKSICFFLGKRGEFAQKYSFDVEKLEKAFVNILENAVKFTQPEGKIDFIVEKAQDTEEETTFRFEIRDNGIGIKRDFLPHIFEPFKQETNCNTTLNGGTGLGLAIAKNIIEFMGGRIDVYSEQGKGSAFVVTLTLQKAEEETAEAYEQNKSEGMNYNFAGKRALLVEDNEINIEITKGILLHKNLEVEVAVNGEEGVACYLEHEPGYYDIILMDIRMPVMDGLMATKQIRSSKHADSQNIPIVAMTANAFEEDVRKSFEAGMNAHLSKPLDIKQMYCVLEHMICKE